jgi:hypothetical protein
MGIDGPRCDPPVTLPPDHAFVVHFSATGGRGRRFAGRVEHLASGTPIFFASLGALLAFFAQLLEAPKDP